MSVSEEMTTETLESSVNVIAATNEVIVSTGDELGTGVVMDLSMKKKKKVNDSPSLPKDATDGDAVKVELIPSAFEVKISELIINADKKNTEVSEGGDAIIIEQKVTTTTTQRPKRAKKRKQAPDKIIQGCKGSDYVIAPAQQLDLPATTEEVIIETTDADNDSPTIAKKGDIVHVVDGAILEVETSKPIGGGVEEEEEGEEEGISLPLKVPTVTVTTSDVSCSEASSEFYLAQLQSSLFNSSILGSNSKPMRPFKLYTQNRDLLAGIGLNQSNMNTLAAALSGRPLASSAIIGSTASLPITAFVPLNVKNPLIPTTIPTGVPETTISQVGSTAGNNGKLVSAATTSVITSTTTSSAMRLMTLATAADKILKGKNQEHNDALEKDTNVPLIFAASDGSASAVGHVNDDGTIELTLDAASPEKLALIQQQIAVTPASDDSDEPKSKKSKIKKQQLPDSLKTPNYWERRRKNNEAAKRSRDARRAKEDQIAIRAAILEHENTRLKIELKALKEETAKLRAEIYERKKSDPK